MEEFERIEGLALDYARAHDDLADRVRQCRDEMEAAKRRHLRPIRRLAARAADARDELAAAVEDNPSLFRRPRTRILHGVRVGFAKGKGRVAWDDAAKVVARIRRLMPGRFKRLVKVTETPVKTALARLPAAELRRIGVTVDDAGDEVVVKPTGDEVDRLVAALLDAAAEED